MIRYIVLSALLCASGMLHAATYTVNDSDCEFVGWSGGLSAKLRDRGNTQDQIIAAYKDDRKKEWGRYRALLQIVNDDVRKVFTVYKDLQPQTINDVTYSSCQLRAGEVLTYEAHPGDKDAQSY